MKIPIKGNTPEERLDFNIIYLKQYIAKNKQNFKRKCSTEIQLEMLEKIKNGK